MNKWKEIRSRGKTFCLVSHSTQAIEEFCSQALWLHKGEAIKFGPAKEVISNYNQFSEKLIFTREFKLPGVILRIRLTPGTKRNLVLVEILRKKSARLQVHF